MAFGTHHVHVKTRDPKQTMQFYVDNLGATLIADMGARGYRVNLHGLQLNITGLIDSRSAASSTTASSTSRWTPTTMRARWRSSGPRASVSSKSFRPITAGASASSRRPTACRSKSSRRSN